MWSRKLKVGYPFQCMVWESHGDPFLFWHFHKSPRAHGVGDYNETRILIMWFDAFLKYDYNLKAPCEKQRIILSVWLFLFLGKSCSNNFGHYVGGLFFFFFRRYINYRNRIKWNFTKFWTVTGVSSYQLTTLFV